jgi:hypothetical protein
VRRRRRYEVVVEGLSGQAASHRSVVSEHRSEAEARENASLERSRLEVIYGENASSWRVLVVRDDEVIHQEDPAGAPDQKSIATPRIRARTSAAPVPDADPSADPEAVVEAEEDAEPGSGDPGEERAPGGRVPDWVLAKFEESIARRAAREDDTSE